MPIIAPVPLKQKMCPTGRCGQGKHLVAMSCKSSLCLRCAKVYVDNWVSQVSQVLHEGVIYRHIILTVPAMFRTTFYQNAAVLLSAFSTVRLWSAYSVHAIRTRGSSAPRGVRPPFLPRARATASPARVRS
jgi:hypothetical protein